ncbi:hypothetical protein HGA91_06555 [candidate division WWE3 bacterium]|nr:hypothetical protein [candidate division WWE3 bacterium]
MINSKQIKEEIELVSTLRIITQAYQEISVMKMQKIRNSVLRTREFLERLSEVFYDVRESYKTEVQDILRKKNRLSKVFPTFDLRLVKKRKSVTVLLSANNKLYGDITYKVFFSFLKQVREHESDIIIIGRVGRDLFLEQEGSRPFRYIEISDVDIGSVDLRNVVHELKDYDQVNVFYGKFENIVNQESTISNVSGSQVFTAEELTQKKQPTEEHRFLFEPSLEQILDFFENQVFASLIKQTVHESHLASFASRIKAMEEALQNIETKSAQLKSDQRRVKRMLNNKKQIETISRVPIAYHG